MSRSTFLAPLRLIARRADTRLIRMPHKLTLSNFRIVSSMDFYVMRQETHKKRLLLTTRH